MPREGYKSITVKDEAYDTLKQEWSKKKKLYIKRGVTSFSGFLICLVEEEKKRNP